MLISCAIKWGISLATEQRFRPNYFQDVVLGQPDYPLPTSFVSEGRVGAASLPAGKQLPTHGFCGLDSYRDSQILLRCCVVCCLDKPYFTWNCMMCTSFHWMRVRWKNEVRSRVKRLLYPCDTGQFDWKKRLRLSSCRSSWSNRCRPESKQMSYWLRLGHKTPSRFWTDWSIYI